MGGTVSRCPYCWSEVVDGEHLAPHYVLRSPCCGAIVEYVYGWPRCRACGATVDPAECEVLEDERE